MGVIMHNGVNYTRKAYEPKIKLVPWSTGTDEEITAMVNAYYSGKFTLEDIKSVWHLGDCRSVNLAAMNATYVGESHRAQTVEMMIIDFEHDDLTTAINSKTKALITLNQKDCLMDVECAEETKYGLNNTENGYMNSGQTNVGGWNGCKRRQWCNEIYYGALPVYLSDIIKVVNKKTSEGSQISTIVTSADKCFLLSELEVSRNTPSYSYDGEGEQYIFLTQAETRKKLPAMYSGSTSSAYWLRSPYKGDANSFCHISDSAGFSYYRGGNKDGIAPAFCL